MSNDTVKEDLKETAMYLFNPNLISEAAFVSRSVSENLPQTKNSVKRGKEFSIPAIFSEKQGRPTSPLLTIHGSSSESSRDFSSSEDNDGNDTIFTWLTISLNTENYIKSITTEIA